MKHFRSHRSHLAYFRSGYFRLFFVLIVVVPLLYFTLSACSTGPQTKASNLPIRESRARSMESKYVASELGAQEVVEVTFRIGSHQLSRKDIRKIQNAVIKARGAGEVDEIRVVTWADNEYPSTYTKKLPEDQQRLAEARGEAIKNELAAPDQVDVKTYNMAQRPGAFESLLKTSDYRMKSALEKAGVPNTHTGVKIPSFAGRAMIMVLTKQAEENKAKASSDSTDLP